MLGSNDHGDLVRIRPVLRLICNDYKPCVVSRIVIDIFRQNIQSVQLRRLPGRHCPFCWVAALAYHLGTPCRIKERYQLNSRVLFKKFTALLQSLRVGIHLFQSIDGSAGKSQQVLIYFYDFFPDDMTVVLTYQVIYFRNTAGR